MSVRVGKISEWVIYGYGSPCLHVGCGYFRNLKQMAVGYTEADIKTLDWREHIRLRPGMYVGKLGDGSSGDDGIYILLKEAVDNSIDEHIMGHGKEIRIEIDDESRVEVRDFGRGIPLGKLFDCAAQINTGAKYDSDAFKKSVGLKDRKSVV